MSGIVEGLDVAVYTVPTDSPEADGTLAWDSTTAVVVHARSGDLSGLGWTYTTPAAAELITGLLAPLVRGGDLHDVPSLNEAMVRAVRNLGGGGIAKAAISAVDVALWDLAARSRGLALCSLLGRTRTSVPVYGSGGFTTYDDDRLREQLTGWVSDLGVSAVKIKIGESWGARQDRDLHRVGVAREAVGPDIELFVDANGAYTVGQAVRVERAMRTHRVTWFEEPVSSEDLAGLGHVRRRAVSDVAAGEYAATPATFAHMLGAGAVDCLQADVTRCGGVTGWLRVADLAHAHGVDLSAHCAPQLSAHVACAAPGVRHLEWFHDHVRVTERLFTGTLTPTEGQLRPVTTTPGHGMGMHPDAESWRVG